MIAAAATLQAFGTFGHMRRHKKADHMIQNGDGNQQTTEAGTNDVHRTCELCTVHTEGHNTMELQDLELEDHMVDTETEAMPNESSL